MNEKIKYALFGSLGTIGALTALGALMAAIGSDTKDPTVAQESPAPVEKVELAVSSKEPTPALPSQPSQQPSATIADHQVAACKAAIALMNDRDVSTFSGRSLDANTVHVEWRRPDDGKVWQARCQPVGDSGLRWAAFNAFGDGQQGRWRDEDTIEAKIEGDRLFVTLRQLGASEKRADYKLIDLG